MPGEEIFIKALKNDPLATYYPKGEMVICYDYLKTKTHRLAYKFAISAHVPESSSYVYVDAITGDIVARLNLLFDVNTSSTVSTKYSGTQTITTDQFLNGSTTAYRLQETRGTSNVSLQTFNSQQVDNTFYTDFTDANNTWTALNNVNQDNVALDAHWAKEKIFDYWNTVRQINSYNNGGAAMISFVHYNPYYAIVNGIPQYHTGTDNSQWDGNNHWVKLGDGYTQFNPLTSFDVCAHEFGHAFTEGAQATLFTSGGILINSDNAHPEANALNEGISDIWGAVVENWGTTGKQTWLIGEEIMKDGKPCLRSLPNPKTGGDPTGTAHGGYPDTYHGTYWDYANASHTNSTVISHWFYLLSQGGSGKNDLANTFAVTGIGITKAANIVWRAEQYYFQANSEYADARTYMINAATDLYCDNSPEVAAVTNAWYAVGVGAVYTGSVMGIAGSGLVCPSTAYSLTNQPAGANLSWTSSNPSGISVGATTGVASVVGSFTGSVTLSANVNNINSGGGSCTNAIMKTISVGYPPSVTGSFNGQPMAFTPYPSGSTINYNSVCAQTNITTSMTITGAASGTWQLISANPSSGITWWQSGNDITFSFAGSSQTARFRFTALNTCGSVSNDYYFQSTNCGGGGCLLYTVSPNPASTTMSIASPTSPLPCGSTTTLSTNQTQTANTLSIQSIGIYDASDGQFKFSKQFSADTKKVDLDVSGLKKGVYVLNISDGTYNEAHRIVIN